MAIDVVIPYASAAILLGENGTPVLSTTRKGAGAKSWMLASATGSAWAIAGQPSGYKGYTPLLNRYYRFWAAGDYYNTSSTFGQGSGMLFRNQSGRANWGAAVLADFKTTYNSYFVYLYSNGTSQFYLRLHKATVSGLALGNRLDEYQIDETTYAPLNTGYWFRVRVQNIDSNTKVAIAVDVSHETYPDIESDGDWGILDAINYTDASSPLLNAGLSAPFIHTGSGASRHYYNDEWCIW